MQELNFLFKHGAPLRIENQKEEISVSTVFEDENSILAHLNGKVTIEKGTTLLNIMETLKPYFNQISAIISISLPSHYEALKLQPLGDKKSKIMLSKKTEIKEEYTVDKAREEFDDIKKYLQYRSKNKKSTGRVKSKSKLLAFNSVNDECSLITSANDPKILAHSEVEIIDGEILLNEVKFNDASSMTMYDLFTVLKNIFVTQYYMSLIEKEKSEQEFFKTIAHVLI